MRYENDGNYNKLAIMSAFETFCEELTLDKSQIKPTDTIFVDYILAVSMDLATGPSVIRFLKMAQESKSKNGNRYSQYQIDCIFKTYANIISARKRKGLSK